MNEIVKNYPEICRLADALTAEAPDLCLDEVRSLLRHRERTAALEDLCVAVDEYEMTHARLSPELRKSIATQCEAYMVDEKYWHVFR